MSREIGEKVLLCAFPFALWTGTKLSSFLFRSLMKLKAAEAEWKLDPKIVDILRWFCCNICWGKAELACNLGEKFRTVPKYFNLNFLASPQVNFLFFSLAAFIWLQGHWGFSIKWRRKIRKVCGLRDIRKGLQQELNELLIKLGQTRLSQG